MDAMERTLTEYRRVLRMMQDGDEDHKIPPMGDPVGINTLAWAIGVLEHEATKDEPTVAVTRRDWFAGMAMQAIVGYEVKAQALQKAFGRPPWEAVREIGVAKQAYYYADMMIAEAAKKEADDASI